MAEQGNCDTCVNFVYDEDYEYSQAEALAQHDRKSEQIRPENKDAYDKSHKKRNSSGLAGRHF